MRAASKISRGRLSKNRFTRIDVERARAGRQPDRPVAVDERVMDDRRVHDLDVERHEQHDRGHEERHRASSPVSTFAYRGRSTESAKPPVVATMICTSHDPNAITIVFQKYRPTFDVRPRLAQVAPRGTVREERHRVGDRVVRRRDRRLREPEDRPEADHDEADEQQGLRAADSKANAGAAPLRGRDQTRCGALERERLGLRSAIIRCSRSASRAGRRARTARGSRQASG